VKKNKKGLEQQAYLPKEYDKTVLERMMGGACPLEGTFPRGAGISNYGALDLPLESGPAVSG
jgi:hypothetical protein